MEGVLLFLKDNPRAEKQLLSVDALPYYNPQSRYFSHNWTTETVSDVLGKINEELKLIRKDFQPVMGELMVTISEQKYLELCEILAPPSDANGDIKHFVQKICPFMLQRMKMWGCHVLQAGDFGRLTKAMLDGCPESNKIDMQCTKKSESDLRIPVSRLDFLTFLIGSADCLVAREILRVMSKFTLAMPLVIRDIQHEKYLVILPLLKDILVRWESQPGTIIENYLFRSPCKLLVAVRLGSSQDLAGKSVILNKLLKTQFFFSSRSEPGGKKYGKPCTVDGAVEFTWLTQETCEDALWHELFNSHYSKGSNELILLANVHGDIQEHSKHLELFESLSCSFLIFVMKTVNSTAENSKLKQCEGQSSSHHYILVDPDTDQEDESKVIRTRDLHDDDTLDKLRSFIKVALNAAPTLSEYDIEDVTDTLSERGFLVSDKIYTDKSQEIIDLVAGYTCKGIRDEMKLQKNVSDKPIVKKSVFDENKDLKIIISTFMPILSLPHSQSKKAIVHLDSELSRLSCIESFKARAEVLSCKEQYRTMIASENQDQNEILQMQEKINVAMNTVDQINLGIEHFFRELSQLYQISFSIPLDSYNDQVLKLPLYCAQLLIEGSAIELLDGDAGTISIDWIVAICKNVMDLCQGLKVFVVSIIGLQSSGKSTLLNALFACNFAVSVGRCTRGLFMRLAFIEGSLRESYGFDAFLIIDTEGLILYPIVRISVRRK